MLSIVPLLAGGGLFETGAGGSAPKHVEQFGSLLTLADMIKFSKATTDEAEILRAYHAAEALILETTALHKILNSQKKGEHDA
jgi:isocitrate dehydrogenase